MNSLESATELAQQALLVAAEISIPVLIAGLVVGLLFSLLQAVTQVHEQAISFIPKLFAMGAVMFFMLPWVLNLLTGYTREILGQLSRIGASP